MLKNSENFLTTTINIDGEEATLNSCNVFLPSIKDNKIEVEITSSDKRITNLSIDEFKISGSKSDLMFNSSCQLSIINGYVISSDFKPNELLDALEYKVRLVPKETYIIKKITNDNSDIAIVRFYVNKAPIITPYTSTIQDPLGCLIKKNLTKLHLNIGDDINISSELNYNFENNNEDITMQPYLVIKTEFSKKTENITKLINEKIFPKVEDFLLISSFIQRDKITCKGWEALYNGVQTSYYRTYMSYADDIKKKDGVPIDATYVPEFLKVTVKRLQENKFKDAIKVAINALNNSNSSTFELSFLSIFQAIESLVNTYKRERDLEFILPKNNFKKLSKKIRDSMKSQEFKSLLNDGGYESIIKKIPELNRLSLSDAFRLMEKEHSLSFHGLWPLFNDGETKGLVNIRNVFAHGGSFPRQTYAALMTARTCLQFFLERLIFQLLGWPIEKTYISDDYLSKYYFSENQILNSQRILLKYLNSKTKE